MKRSDSGVFATLGLVLTACSLGDAGQRPAVEPPTSAQAVTTARSAPAVRPPAERRETAILAGGCFWGMEELLRKQPGVIDTTVGYTGGTVAEPEYPDVKAGSSGHAESVRVEFDPARTSYEKILLYFFTIHDPTTKNRQGNDVGSQYRSAIFVRGEAQRRVAERVKRRAESSGAWQGPITTQIVDATTFYPAEDYHQDYLQRIPGGYSCHYERDIAL